MGKRIELKVEILQKKVVSISSRCRQRVDEWFIPVRDFEEIILQYEREKKKCAFPNSRQKRGVVSGRGSNTRGRQIEKNSGNEVQHDTCRI
jgi:hypothetical protein